jgi:hypothetical protein
MDLPTKIGEYLVHIQNNNIQILGKIKLQIKINSNNNKLLMTFRGIHCNRFSKTEMKVSMKKLPILIRLL